MIKLKVQKSPKHDLNVLPLASSANRKKNGHMTVSFFFFILEHTLIGGIKLI